MKTINVSVKDKPFKIYVVNYDGEEVNVAEPKLESAIDECIQDNEYYDNCAKIEGEECSVSDVSDLYYYVFGDEDNDNPSEQDIIDSISDVWEGNV